MKGRAPVQIVAGIAGALFLLAGIAGFVPGLTTDYDELSFAGHDSQARLLGLFQVSVLHNLVHLAFGSGLLFARTAAGARAYLLWSGFVSLALWLAGVIGVLGGLPANTDDNWLHLLLGLGLFVLLALTSRQDLGHDLECDLGRGLTAEVEPDGPVH